MPPSVWPQGLPLWRAAGGASRPAGRALRPQGSDGDRRIAACVQQARLPPLPPPCPRRQERYAAWRDWVALYRGRLQQQGLPDEERAALQAGASRAASLLGAAAAHACKGCPGGQPGASRRAAPPPTMRLPAPFWPACPQDAANPAIVPRNHVMVGIISEAEVGNYEPLHRCGAALRPPRRCAQRASHGLAWRRAQQAANARASPGVRRWQWEPGPSACSGVGVGSPSNHRLRGRPRACLHPRPCWLMSADGAPPWPAPAASACRRYMAALLRPYSGEGLDPAWLEPAPKQCRLGVELLSCSS